MQIFLEIPLNSLGFNPLLYFLLFSNILNNVVGAICTS